jgi:integrase
VFHAAVYRRCGYLRGVPLAVIAKWLGHANPAIAARIYAHSQDEALAAAAASFDERRCSA